jgi:hypothetical protein
MIEMIYIMNSAVMPAGNFGTYEYSPATVCELAAVVRESPDNWCSCIGYAQNIELIEGWTGVRIPLSRTETAFKDGDRAIIMRLKRRVADPATKGAAVSESPDDWEFAWLTFRE